MNDYIGIFYGGFNKTSLMSPGCKWVLPDGVSSISRLITTVCHSSLFTPPKLIIWNIIVIILSIYWVDPITQNISNWHPSRRVGVFFQ